MMRQAEVVEYNKPLVIREVPIPEPPPTGLVIKTSFAGLCHSDIHVWEDEFKLGDGKAIKMSQTVGPSHLPLVLGHEIAGIVHSVGSEQDEDEDQLLKVGDRVALYPWLGCGNCGICRGPSPHYCASLKCTLGIIAPGGFSEYVAISRRKHVFKIPENVPLDVASTYMCSGLTTYNAVSAVKETVNRFAEMTGKATLMIIGAGGLGLWCVQMAKATLPSNVKILSVDISQDKLSGAREAGADATVLWEIGISDEDAVKRVFEAAGGPVEAVCDFVGSGITATRALGVVNKGGIIVPVGLFGGKFETGVPALIFKMSTIAPKYVGSLQQLVDVIKLGAEGKIKSPPLIHIPLDEINDAMTKLRDGKISGRVVIKY